jgi:GTP-binding protein
MTRKIPAVAIVGRTNVGKSTLFNAIAGRRVAVVEDTPGVTRDRNYLVIGRHGFPFTLIDTGGLIGEESSGLEEAVRLQSDLAIKEADLILAVFDGLAGPQPHDADVVDNLRRSGKTVIAVVNKCEKPATAELAAEFYTLGLDDLVFVSAAHRIGIQQLIATIREHLNIREEDQFEEREPLKEAIRVAILGKPNVGKSTLVNTLVGEARVVASPIPGTTRDNIDVTVKRDGHTFVVVDTAGLRKKNKVDPESAERYGNLRSLKALVQCDVAVLMLDATAGLPTEQDARIAGLIHERGKSLIIVVNKWDAVEKDHTTVKAYTDMVHEVFKFARYAPIVFASALTGRRCPSILDTVLEVHQAANMRIATSDLNRLLDRAFTEKPPPVYRGHPVKLFFAVQASVSPPTIVLFMNFPKRINYGYERYLKNQIREVYPFPGNDIKFQLKKRSEKADQAGNAAR